MSSTDSWALYASPPRSPRHALLSCRGAGAQSGKVLPFRSRSLPTHGLVYVSEGRGSYAEHRPRHVEFAVEAPAVIWLAPGIEHGYGPDREGWTEQWILYAGEGVAAFSDLGLSSRHRPVLPLARPVDTADSLFEDLRACLGARDAGSEVRASVATQRMLLAVVDAAGESDNDADGSSVVAVVAREAMRPLTVQERAGALGLAPRDLRRIVRSATGRALNDFVIDTRIATAQGLLAETRLDVGQVASRVGYSDPAYFSRLFARRVGVSPSAFRRQQSRGLID